MAFFIISMTIMKLIRKCEQTGSVADLPRKKPTSCDVMTANCRYPAPSHTGEIQTGNKDR